MTTPSEEPAATPGGADEPAAAPPLGPGTVPVDLASVVVDWLAKANVTVKPETSREVTARLAKEAADAESKRAEDKAAADHRRRFEMVVLVAALAVVPVCLWTLTDAKVSAESKLWASNLVVLIFGNLTGYMTGRIPGRSSEK